MSAEWERGRWHRVRNPEPPPRVFGDWRDRLPSLTRTVVSIASDGLAYRHIRTSACGIWKRESVELLDEDVARKLIDESEDE